MKKILISILLILSALLAYFAVIKHISFLSWRSSNFIDIKNEKMNLDSQINVAKQINNQEYLSSVEGLETSIDEYKKTKLKYEAKTANVSDDTEIGIVKIKNYKIERIWVILQNYAKKEKIELELNLLDTTTPNVYDLDVTLLGDYIGITDFLYDIENDDTLGFKITNFKLLPSTTVSTTTAKTENATSENTTSGDNNTTEENKDTTNTNTTNTNTTNTTNTTTSVSVSKLKATFKIEEVGIEFN